MEIVGINLYLIFDSTILVLEFLRIAIGLIVLDRRVRDLTATLIAVIGISRLRGYTTLATTLVSNIVLYYQVGNNLI